MGIPYQELVPVNFYIRLPGVADGIHHRRMAFDPWRLQLIVDGPDGVIAFTGVEDFVLQVLDLSVPIYLRINSPDDGWCFMDIAEFINVLHLDYLSY